MLARGVIPVKGLIGRSIVLARGVIPVKGLIGRSIVLARGVIPVKGLIGQYIFIFFQWQEVITGFRAGMPRHKKRVKMRQYENCFTGGEAVEWLHSHLQSTGLFGSPSRQQVGLE